MGGESTANFVSTPHQSETPQEQRFILNVNWNRSEKNFRHINVAVNFPIKRNANLHFIQHPPWLSSGKNFPANFRSEEFLIELKRRFAGGGKSWGITELDFIITGFCFIWSGNWVMEMVRGRVVSMTSSISSSASQATRPNSAHSTTTHCQSFTYIARFSATCFSRQHSQSANDSI
jgi:hypothetical protein